MADAPEPDLHPDEALVVRLVAAQHPDLAGPVRRETNGWDNVMFRLGDDLAVRMPRRELAVPLVLHEQRWLPGLAAGLPVPVPAPIRAGAPAPEFGYDAPWSIVPWLPGSAALGFSEPARDAAADALAEFVFALGAPAPADAPRNAFRGVPLAARDASVRARLAGGRVADPEGVGRAWDRALSASVWQGPPCWLHGDLHPGNLLLHDDGSLAAVVDFGDLTSGDPATDLATAWLTFGRHGRERFERRVEALMGAGTGRGARIDAAKWERAQGWALVLATAMVDATDARSPLGRLGARVLAEIVNEHV
ncbi:Predicted kinase, aminoglycoside phosphotransferase (APT) family [Agromyces sp. CF514]|uniref:aminoglycoside phosphotransferase family protein n=1 Tax=Agromyces sp. CF514 TaxID=1881031 RepID=UPI0008DED5C1|nr:aminoglycoside phosphotransferase family protein [Agromyces sp. CF514]SFR67135.1 Predicted kinase, aminoglycoside phosphotransferase (APT) family [Agromyces sp. CF514]